MTAGAMPGGEEAETAAEPLVGEVGVIALVPDRWASYWQPRHQVLSRLARYFRIEWVEPALDWREALSAAAPEAPVGMPPAPPGLHVLPARRWPPRLHRPDWALRLAWRSWLTGARRRLWEAGCRRIVLYLWRPDFAVALELLEHDLSCYHVDDEYAFDAAEAGVDPVERALLESVGQVFIHSPALIEKKGGLNPFTLQLPNGVDYAAYARPGPEPVDLHAVPRPRIGYTGFLKRQLDWPRLADLIGSRGDWSFVFVGPVSPHPELERRLAELRRRDNVFLLGGRSPEQLAAYPQHFDVCLMPYRADAYTRFIYPLKLHEFLASGSPVVATRIRSLEDFGEVVGLAEPGAGWEAEIQAALEPAARSEAACSRRQAVAAAYDWDGLVQRLARTLAERLSPSLVARVEAAARSGSPDRA